MIEGVILLGKMSLSQTANVYYAMKLFVFSVLVRARKKTSMKGYGWRIQVKKFGRKADLYFKDLSDYLVFKEIFFEEDYGRDFKVGERAILDIGANNGFTAVFFALKYPKCTIYALEPDPRTFVRLVANTKSLSQVSPMQVAITDTPGIVSFYSMPRALSSSMIMRSDQAEKIQVLGQTLDHLLDSINGKIGLLKFDVEGAEYAMIHSWQNQKDVRNIVGELHLDLIGVDKETFLQCLSSFEIEEFQRGDKRIVLYGKQR